MSPSKDEDPGTPKIAMKGFSLNAKSSSKPRTFATKPTGSASSTLGKRPRSALHHGSDDDDYSDEEHRPGHGRHEEVTGFDIREGGAVRKSDHRGGDHGATGRAADPLVIPKQKTRDFREEIRRARMRGSGKNLLPPEVQAQRERMAREGGQNGNGNGNGNGLEAEVMVEEQPQWGLTVTKTVEGQTTITNGAGRHHGNGEMNPVPVEVTTTSTTTTLSPIAGGPAREKTDDELALEALLGAQTLKKGADLVITRNDTEDDYHNSGGAEDETDAYRRAIAAAPDVSTLEDYERVPVEEFGAALLRGMGWKGEDTKNRLARPKDVKRRQNLLGLGAKELKEAEELGAWVQHSDPKRLHRGNKSRNGGGGERRPRANEYREREERKREDRDERHGSYRRERERERDDYRDRDRRY